MSFSMRFAFILFLSLISLAAKSSENEIISPSTIQKSAQICPLVAKIYTADGFDYPLARPNGKGYYKSRGWMNRHPGEDWVALDRNHILGAPVYAIGSGIVVFTRNAPGGWGNVVILRHAYYEEKKLHCIDSFYAHLHRVLVHEGQFIAKGQQIGEVGTNRGMYPPHLHLEIRKNLSIGINRAGYARNFHNYCPPTAFIEIHRKIQKAGRMAQIPIATFEHHSLFPLPIDESRIRWKRSSRPQKRYKNKKKQRVSVYNSSFIETHAKFMG